MLSDRIKKIDLILEKFYGIPERKSSKPLTFEIIHTILSQNTNDKNSLEAFRKLQTKYPSFEMLAAAKPQEIAETIKIGGLGLKKAEYIANFLSWLKNNYNTYDCDFICGMSTDEAISIFTRVKGIGIKTIAVALTFSCGRDLFPVDTHVFRVSGRIGLIPGIKSPEKAFYFLRDLIPPGKGFSLHMNIIRLGREICHARTPECRLCPIKDTCEYGKSTEIQ